MSSEVKPACGKKYKEGLIFKFHKKEKKAMAASKSHCIAADIEYPVHGNHPTVQSYKSMINRAIFQS